MTAEAVETRPRANILRTLLEVAVVVVFALLVWNNYTMRRQQSRAAAVGKSERAFVVRDQPGVIPATGLDGRRRDLDLRDGRAVVAVIDPRCESCREILAQARNVPEVRLLSVAPLAETRQGGVPPSTRVVVQPFPEQLGMRLAIYPQVFVVEGGQVVRTCATVAECR
jgi:hypothetical protein